MKIAIIGSGISGLSCAYALSKKHDITVFERQSRIGGHTATIDVEHLGERYSIDTGFIVYNDWTYPNFIKLLEKIGVENQPTNMSFSVNSKKSGLEYSGSSLNTLFAQRKNLFKPSFYAMLFDILRFNRETVADFESNNIDSTTTLGEYLKTNRYGDWFRNYYLIPMGSAIWSATPGDMLNFPLLFFVRFFKNHGLLSITDRPQWRVIKGGSSAYLRPLTAEFADKIVTNSNIESIRRSEGQVMISFTDGREASFDQVVLACHSDQALALIEDPSPEEKDILAAIPYRDNEVILHTDDSILPKRKLAWASWNYHLGNGLFDPAELSYNMNILQGIKSQSTFVVTLNSARNIDEDKIIGRYRYAHPVFSRESTNAQLRWTEINGKKRTWFCGAYWSNGFHEDGCASGLRVANALGADPL